MPELRELEVHEVALVGKAANKKKFLIVKSASSSKTKKEAEEMEASVDPVDGVCPATHPVKRDGKCWAKDAAEAQDETPVKGETEEVAASDKTKKAVTVAQVETAVANREVYVDLVKTRKAVAWVIAALKVQKRQAASERRQKVSYGNFKKL